MEPCTYYQELISEYIDDMLPPEEKEEMTEHLKSCSECKSEYLSMWTMVKLLKIENEVELPVDFETSLHKKMVQTSSKRGFSIPWDFQFPWKFQAPWKLPMNWNFKRWNNLTSIASMAAVMVLVTGWYFYGDILEWSQKGARFFVGNEPTSPPQITQKEVQKILPSLHATAPVAIEKEVQKQDSTAWPEAKLEMENEKPILLPTIRPTMKPEYKTAPAKPTMKPKTSKQESTPKKITSTTKPTVNTKNTNVTGTVSKSSVTSQKSTQPKTSLAMDTARTYNQPQTAKSNEEEGYTGSFSSSVTTSSVSQTKSASVGVYSKQPEQCLNEVSKILSAKGLHYSTSKNNLPSGSKTYASVQVQMNASEVSRVQREIGNKYKTVSSGVASSEGTVTLTIQIIGQ